MRIVDREELIKLPSGTVFCEYVEDSIRGDWHVKHNNTNFGANLLIPWHGEIVNYDWNAYEDNENQKYLVMDVVDILATVKTITEAYHFSPTERVDNYGDKFIELNEYENLIFTLKSMLYYKDLEKDLVDHNKEMNPNNY